MGRTKKIGSAGRFGVRYGSGIKKEISKIEVLQKRRHECPYCSKSAVKRLSKGIYLCRSCNSKFTGKCYTPE